MAKLSIKPGSTNVSLPIFIQDSTGAGKTGLAYNTASLVCYYVRPGAVATALALVTQTVTGAHADGGFVEIDATNMPGAYRLDLHDDIVAVGVRSAMVMLKGATGMAPLVLEIDLKAEVDTTHLAGTAQTARDIGASVLLSSGTGTGQISLTSGAVTAGTVSDKTGYSLTATTGLGNQTADITGNLSGSVGSVTGAVGSVASGGITATSIADDAIGAGELAAGAAEKIADAILNRNEAGGSNSGRLVKEALYPLRNKVAVSGGTMTVYGPDDSTPSWTATVITTTGASPITSVDPSGP